MKPVTVVLDTNVLVSALLTPNGLPAEILNRILGGEILLYCSSDIFLEYQVVLKRKKFGFSTHSVHQFLDELETLSIFVTPTQSFSVCKDPEDNKFIDCAIASEASYIVTGNLKHFPAHFKGIQILSPTGFLRKKE